MNVLSFEARPLLQVCLFKRFELRKTGKLGAPGQLVRLAFFNFTADQIKQESFVYVSFSPVFKGAF